MTFCLGLENATGPQACVASKIRAEGSPVQASAVKNCVTSSSHFCRIKFLQQQAGHVGGIKITAKAFAFQDTANCAGNQDVRHNSTHGNSQLNSSSPSIQVICLARCKAEQLCLSHDSRPQASTNCGSCSRLMLILCAEGRLRAPWPEGCSGAQAISHPSLDHHLPEMSFCLHCSLLLN